MKFGDRREIIRRFSTEIQEMVDMVRSDKYYDEYLGEELRAVVESNVFQYLETCNRYVAPFEIQVLIEATETHLSGGYGVIRPMLEDDSVNEIMINSPYEIFAESDGSMTYYDTAFLSEEELEGLIRKLASDVHREINEANPIVDARTREGYRVNAILRNVAIRGPVLTIRKFSKQRITYEKLIEDGVMSRELGDELREYLDRGYNLFISGGTSAGKTTMLGALCSAAIEPGARLVVIEDSAELDIKGMDNIVYLECRSANSIGKGEITMSNLIKTSLRMRPDRIVVGEVRGREVVDMIQAMNTGHDGSVSTGHGNSIEGMLARLESMYMMGVDAPVPAIRKQIANAIDIMIHMKRDRNGKRRISEVAEIAGVEQGEYELNYLYVTDRNGEVIPTGNLLCNRDKYERLQ